MCAKQLGSPRLFAERRLHAIERRLEREPELKIQYHIFIKENEKLCHMETLRSQERRQTSHFLAQHAVFKETSSKKEFELISMEVP